MNLTVISLDVLMTDISATNDSYYDNSSYYSYDFDPGACNNMHCIWLRMRKSRLHILRPLTFLLSMIGLVGIVGNIFVILVFSRTIAKRTSTYLVLLLAILDLIACSIVIPGTILKEWYVKFKSDLVCKGWELLRNSAIISSAVILAAIAFDRFLLVYRRNNQAGSKYLTLGMILFTVLLGISLGVVPMLGVGVYMESPQGLINIEVCFPNSLILPVQANKIYWKVITCLFGLLISTIIILYLLIFILVYKHSARAISRNQVGPRTNMSPTFHLPFVGVSRSEKPPSFRGKSAFVDTKTPTANSQKKKGLFRKRNLNKSENKVVRIKVIGNISSSSSGLDEEREPEPGPSGIQRLHPTNPNLLTPGGTTNQNHLNSNLNSTNQKQAFTRNQSAHIKTTKVLCIITTVYTIAFLPMFLETHGVIERNEIIYLYFINNAANPIIYSFMNTRFRKDVQRMFAAMCNRLIH